MTTTKEFEITDYNNETGEVYATVKFTLDTEAPDISFNDVYGPKVEVPQFPAPDGATVFLGTYKDTHSREDEALIWDVWFVPDEPRVLIKYHPLHTHIGLKVSQLQEDRTPNTHPVWTTAMLRAAEFGLI